MPRLTGVRERRDVPLYDTRLSARVRHRVPFASSGWTVRKARAFDGRELKRHKDHEFIVVEYGFKRVEAVTIQCRQCSEIVWLRHVPINGVP